MGHNMTTAPSITMKASVRLGFAGRLDSRHMSCKWQGLPAANTAYRMSDCSACGCWVGDQEHNVQSPARIVSAERCRTILILDMMSDSTVSRNKLMARPEISVAGFHVQQVNAQCTRHEDAAAGITASVMHRGNSDSDGT
jgi:hypothetical protein